MRAAGTESSQTRNIPPARNQGRRFGVPPLVPFLFLGAILIAVAAHQVPSWIAWSYLGMSAVAFIGYGYDKRCAERERSRIPEATLHSLEFLCGWPGAYVAQRVFRHKTRKLSFLVVFWFIVLLHVSLWASVLADRNGWLPPDSKFRLPVFVTNVLRP